MPWLDGLEGSQLVKEWWKSVQEVYDVYKVADPKTRVKWPGVEMSAKSRLLLGIWKLGLMVTKFLTF